MTGPAVRGRRAVLAVVVVLVATASACSSARAVHTRAPVVAPVLRSAWERPVDDEPSQLAADARDAVEVSGDGSVVALAPADGAPRWRASVGAGATPFVPPALGPATIAISATDRFAALDRTTGRVRWVAAADGEARAVAVAGPPGTELVVGATQDGRLVGRDALDGAVRWSLAGPGTLDTHLGVGPDGAALAAVWRARDGGVLRLLDPVSGAIRWEQAVDASVASPAVGRDAVVVAEGDGHYHARVRALGLRDGAIRWSSPVPASFEPDLEPGLDEAADQVAVADHLGHVSLLDLGSGRLRWQRATGVPTLGGRAVLVAGPAGAVAVRNEGQEVVILERRRGGIVARRRGVGVPEAVAESGGRLLVIWRRAEPGRVEALTVGTARRRR